LQEELPEAASATFGNTQGSAAALSDLCRRAEATGAESLWAVDHLYWPHPISECLTTLAIAAAATRRPTLGTCVLQLPLRRSAAVAKQSTALQLLSGGRFILGLGVGSHAEEYARARIDFHQRGRLMNEGIAELQQAWATADDPEATYDQQPGAPRVPLWIGGASPAARRRAAAVGDGWVPLFITADDYGTSLEALRRETVEAGRTADDVEAAVVVFVRVGREDDIFERGAQWLSELYGVPAKAFERHLVAGPSEACAAALARYVEAGARHVVVMVAGPDAVAQFGFLRSAFVALTETMLTGVGV
jgi:alkanesulfonate monooxygenase SsuD/methylene tetrahydromethanopterin reductase-like flavin-dependent oxidoreductase (luciferase family)